MNIPSKYRADGVWLAKWVNEQKQIYAGKREGKMLREDQVKRLEEIGISWGRCKNNQSKDNHSQDKQSPEKQSRNQTDKNRKDENFRITLGSLKEQNSGRQGDLKPVSYKDYREAA